MKKLITFLIIIIQASSFSQIKKKSVAEETTQKLKKNEIKVNFGMLLLNIPEISYERLFSENQSIGVSFGVAIKDEMDQGISYMITPQYRVYFGKKRAAGFFMEFNASLYEERINSYWNYFYSGPYSTKRTNVGLGISGGGKFITNNNLIGEVNLGIGSGLLHRNLYYGNDYYPRVGFSLGKRF